MQRRSPPWDLEDLDAWNALVEHRTPLNALFQEAVRRSLTICLPPDCALLETSLDEEFMRLHILVPDPHHSSSFTPLHRGRGAASKTRLKIMQLTMRSSSPSSNLSSAGSRTGEDDALSDRVDRIEAQPYPLLVAAGPSWGYAPVRARVLWEEDVRGDGGTARVAVLDRALMHGAGSNILDAPIPKIAQFGDLRSDNLMTASDVLFELDQSGELLRCLNSELQAFREHYQLIEGLEEDLFSRVQAISTTQTLRWIGNLGSQFLSRRKSVRAVSLAVNTYVHGRLFQVVFPAMSTVHAVETAEFESGAETIRRSGKTLRDFDVPADIAISFDIRQMEPFLTRLNVSTSPFDKIQACCEALDAVSRLVSETPTQSGGISADVLVPVLAYSMSTYPPRDMPAQLAYIARFLPPESCRGSGEERAYALVSISAAVEYIRRYCDSAAVQSRVSEYPGRSASFGYSSTT